MILTLTVCMLYSYGSYSVVLIVCVCVCVFFGVFFWREFYSILECVAMLWAGLFGC